MRQRRRQNLFHAVTVIQSSSTRFRTVNVWDMDTNSMLPIKRCTNHKGIFRNTQKVIQSNKTNKQTNRSSSSSSSSLQYRLPIFNDNATVLFICLFILFLRLNRIFAIFFLVQIRPELQRKWL